MSGSDNQGSVVTEGEPIPYQRPGTFSSKINPNKFCEGEPCQANSFPDRQHNSHQIFIENEGGGGTKPYLDTDEYLPSVLNVIADRESRETMDSSEWKSAPRNFLQLWATLS